MRPLLRVALALAILFSAGLVDAKPFDCANHQCGLLTKGNNRDLVVGTVDGVASRPEMRKVFAWAHRHGYWSSLPDKGAGYLKYMQLISLSVPVSGERRSVTVLMTRQEFESASLQIGAFVRYSPHDSAHDAISYKNPVHEAYWVLVGCVAQLCAPGDDDCRSRYRAGRFDHKSGHQLRVANGKPLTDGIFINPLTLLPVKAGSNQ